LKHLEEECIASVFGCTKFVLKLTQLLFLASHNAFEISGFFFSN
jgi:hypothetical protein